MVILLLLFSRLLFASPTGTSVQLELSKTDFYQGEQVVAQFYVMSDSPQAEVEVVKFPEFKGYWSENQALRQGILPMMPVYKTTKSMNTMPIWGQGRFQGIPIKYKGLIGAYTLIPMMIKREWIIEPMKVLVKGDESSEDRILTHEIPSHKIHTLPPLPSVFQSNLFFGAVGNFNVEIQETEIGFRDNEAAGIRISLSGLGNFQDIDTLPLSLPAIVEPSSNRSFTQTHAGSGQKSFEWDVIVHSDQNFSIDEGRFYYFNPQLKKYALAKIPKLTFTKLPPLPILAPELSLQTRPIENEWTAQWDLSTNKLFCGLQAFAFIILVLINIPKKQPSKIVSPKLVLKHQDTPAFTQELYEVAIDRIEIKLSRKVRHLTHKELIKCLSSELHSITADLIPIIDSYQTASYSQDKNSPYSQEALKDHFKSLLKKAA